MNSKVFVVAHKKFNCPAIKNYSPLLVGNKDFNIKGAYRDNTGDNIANKNANYCELTGLYWIWKNYVGSEKWLGLVHYRRYFSTTSIFGNHIFFLNDKKIKKILSNKDCILPIPLKLNTTVAKNYYKNGDGKLKDLKTTEYVIKKLYPEYLEAFREVIEGNKASYCNMMIMSRKYFNSYCAWLFDILFQVERKTDLTNYSKSEKRIYGYLSEILLNVWVRKNKLRIQYMPVIFTEENSIKRLAHKILN